MVAKKETSPWIRQVQENRRRISPLRQPGDLRGFRLAFHMKALVALAQRFTGLAFREKVLNLGLSAGKIAIDNFPYGSASRLGWGRNLLIFGIV
jgi:hypothetical protein